jgi:cytochrome c
MAGLDLRTLASILKGSVNGPVVVEGASDKSILIRKVASHSMPPPGMGEPLDEAQIGVLRGWIDEAHFSSSASPSL